jgi:hypothetical protein
VEQTAAAAGPVLVVVLVATAAAVDLGPQIVMEALGVEVAVGPAAAHQMAGRAVLAAAVVAAPLRVAAAVQVGLAAVVVAVRVMVAPVVLAVAAAVGTIMELPPAVVAAASVAEEVVVLVRLSGRAGLVVVQAAFVSRALITTTTGLEVEAGLVWAVPSSSWLEALSLLAATAPFQVAR